MDKIVFKISADRNMLLYVFYTLLQFVLFFFLINIINRILLGNICIVHSNITFISVEIRTLYHRYRTYFFFAFFLKSHHSHIMEVTNIDKSWYSDFFVDYYIIFLNEQRKDCHCFSSDLINLYITGGLASFFLLFLCI